MNSGFPEASQNATALRICRRFADEARFEWAGGIALGGGEAIGGRPLAKVGGMARNVVRALDLAASELAAGRPVPEAAIRLMARPLVPTWLYLLFGRRGWRRRAARHHAGDRMDARPYAPGSDRGR